tara:strand:+ start:2179 stop:2484 length:306 start_codon:yes stop_codon:yes gene_type:complete
MSILSENLYLRTMIREILSEVSCSSDHRMLDGSTVQFGTPSCIADISARIADAEWIRDTCASRSDARGHYNGVLNVLRRQKRSALKELDKLRADGLLQEVD